jgi:Ca2+-binding RTX toxin-like protein
LSLKREGEKSMVRRIALMLTLAAFTAVLLGVGVGGTPVAGKPTSGASTIDCAQQKDNVCQGSSGNDTIIGTSGDDNISPGFGDDTVYGLEGDDQVRHSGGDDYIEGGPGADTLRGGFGHDRIYDNTASRIGDGDHDLIDCAYLESRGNTGPDLGFGEGTDTIVDCSNRDDQ